MAETYFRRLPAYAIAFWHGVKPFALLRLEITHKKASFVMECACGAASLKSESTPFQGVLPGFSIGRYDVRFSSIEDVRKGKGFAILKLNGAASEATNAYDSSNSLCEAYRILFRQWEFVFAIYRREPAARKSCRFVGKDFLGMAALSGTQPLSPSCGLSNVQREFSTPRRRIRPCHEPGRKAFSPIGPSAGRAWA